MDFPIIPISQNHRLAGLEIYREGIATGNATFETELPDWEKLGNGHRKDCRLVAVEQDIPSTPRFPAFVSRRSAMIRWDQFSRKGISRAVAHS